MLPNIAQLRAAEDALRAILRFDHPADAVLRGFFREHRELGQRDRAFVAELAFAVVRHLRLLETLAGGRQPRRLLLAALAVLDGRSARQLEPRAQGRRQRMAGASAWRRSDEPAPAGAAQPARLGLGASARDPRRGRRRGPGARAAQSRAARPAREHAA